MDHSYASARIMFSAFDVFGEKSSELIALTL